MLAPDIGIEGVAIRVSARFGGVSEAPWDSLNLGDHVGDHPAHVAENRRRLRQALSVPAISWLRQVHGTRVIRRSMRPGMRQMRNGLSNAGVLWPFCQRTASPWS